MLPYTSPPTPPKVPMSYGDNFLRKASQPFDQDPTNPLHTVLIRSFGHGSYDPSLAGLGALQEELRRKILGLLAAEGRQLRALGRHALQGACTEFARAPELVTPRSTRLAGWESADFSVFIFGQRIAIYGGSGCEPCNRLAIGV